MASNKEPMFFIIKRMPQKYKKGRIETDVVKQGSK